MNENGSSLENKLYQETTKYISLSKEIKKNWIKDATKVFICIKKFTRFIY